MKDNNEKCFYKDCQGRCTHKNLPTNCPFNNKEKCPMHNSWFKALKSLRIDNKALEQDIKEGLEMYKQWRVLE